MSKRTTLLAIALGAAMTAAAPAADLTFSYTDPVGDSTGQIDVTQMVVVFDSVTGNYKITITSTNAQPFVGPFRVDVNLFNPTRLPLHSFFQDAPVNLNLATAQTKLILTGTNPNLVFWAAGDTVSTNTQASGGLNPPGSTLYRTTVSNFPMGFLTNEDAIAYGPNGNAVITVQTAQGALTGLMDDVTVLQETGSLNGGNANALIAKLSAALASLNNGHTKPGCNQIQAFINQVNSLVTGGTLTAAQGQALIQAANAIMMQIPC
jgi:hypothetical protein